MSISRSKYIEVLALLLNFSPLIPDSIKSIIILFILLKNISYIIVLPLNKAMIILFMLIIFLINMVYDIQYMSALSDFNILSLYFPLCFLVGLVISEKYDIEEFLLILDKLIFILAIFSIVGVFIYTFVPELVSIFPKYNYYHTTHRTMLVTNFLTSDTGAVIQRNTGIASEPGMFQFLLNLGMFSYLRSYEKPNNWKLFLYSVAIITTNSTAGLLIFAGIVMELFFKNRKNKVLLLILGLVFMIPVLELIAYQLEYKWIGSIAFEKRFDPIINVIHHGKNKLLGFGNSGYDMYLNVLNIGAWDSFGQIFIRYGYLLLGMIILLLGKIYIVDKMLFFIIFITFSSQGIWFFPLLTSMYFLVWNKPRIEEKKDFF